MVVVIIGDDVRVARSSRCRRLIGSLSRGQYPGLSLGFTTPTPHIRSVAFAAGNGNGRFSHSTAPFRAPGTRGIVLVAVGGV